jgi:hypothetical protein
MLHAVRGRVQSRSKVDHTVAALSDRLADGEDVNVNADIEWHGKQSEFMLRNENKVFLNSVLKSRYGHDLLRHVCDAVSVARLLERLRAVSLFDGPIFTIDDGQGE